MRLPTTRRGRFAIVLCGLLFLILGTFYAGSIFGRYLVVNYLLFEYPLSIDIKASLRQSFHLDHSYSLAEGAQDRWIARCLMPGKRDGFYADVGSADGTISSDTKLPDELGWKGVCIDPFPAHMEDRTCQVFRQPVFSESGKKVTFRAAGELGGIDQSLGSHKAVAEEGRSVELVTATLDEILDKAKAPRRIDYMSLDIEGGNPMRCEDGLRRSMRFPPSPSKPMGRPTSGKASGSSWRARVTCGCGRGRRTTGMYGRNSPNDSAFPSNAGRGGSDTEAVRAAQHG